MYMYICICICVHMFSTPLSVNNTSFMRDSAPQSSSRRCSPPPSLGTPKADLCACLFADTGITSHSCVDT